MRRPSPSSTREKEQVQAGAFPLFQPEHAEDPRVGDRPVHDDVVAPPRDQGHHGPAGLPRLPGFVRLAIGRLQRAGGDAAEVLNRLVPGNGHPAFQPGPAGPAGRRKQRAPTARLQWCRLPGPALSGRWQRARWRRPWPASAATGVRAAPEMGPGIDPGKLVSRGKRQDLARPRIRHLHRDGDGAVGREGEPVRQGSPSLVRTWRRPGPERPTAGPPRHARVPRYDRDRPGGLGACSYSQWVMGRACWYGGPPAGVILRPGREHTSRGDAPWWSTSKRSEGSTTGLKTASTG